MKQEYHYTLERLIHEKYQITATSKEEAIQKMNKDGQIPFEVRIVEESITHQSRVKSRPSKPDQNG